MGWWGVYEFWDRVPWMLRGGLGDLWVLGWVPYSRDLSGNGDESLGVGPPSHIYRGRAFQFPQSPMRGFGGTLAAGTVFLEGGGLCSRGEMWGLGLAGALGDQPPHFLGHRQQRPLLCGCWKMHTCARCTLAESPSSPRICSWPGAYGDLTAGASEWGPP